MGWEYELMVEVRCTNGHRGLVPIGVLRDHSTLLVCQKCESKIEQRELSSASPTSAPDSASTPKLTLRERYKKEKAEREAVEHEVSKLRQWLDGWGSGDHQEP